MSILGKIKFWSKETKKSKHSCPNCTKKRMKERNATKSALPCVKCGGYYPGDCCCSDCCCTGCNIMRCPVCGKNDGNINFCNFCGWEDENLDYNDDL